MCLSEVYTDEDMNRIVEELPEVAPGVVEVWKTLQVHILDEVYYCCDRNHRDSYCPGYNSANTGTKIKLCGFNPPSYWSGFHCWPDNKKAKYLESLWDETASARHLGKHCAIKCLIKKEWITTAGQGRSVEVLVTSAAFFPTYPETEAKLEDFLKWLKENDPEWAKSEVALIKSK